MGPRVMGPVAAILVLAGSCSDPLAPEAREFADARALWASSAPTAYRFDFQRFCFCGPGVARVLRITVEGSTVASAQFVDTGEPVTDFPIPIPTIDELFETIADAIERDAYRLEASYDSELGFPTNAAIDYSAQIADEELGFTVSAFEALPPGE